MTKVNHVPNASVLITEAFSKMPEQWKQVCMKLRTLVHKAEPAIIEDWKWGANFYKDGMVCNIWGFKNHASIVFFNGASMKDKHKLFNAGEANSRSRTIKFTDINQVNDKLIIEYVKESAGINKKGEPKAIAEIKLPEDLKNLFVKHKVLKRFEALNFTARKEIIVSIGSAKRESTRQRRIDKAIESLKK